MAESALMVEIVPLRTEEDKRLFGMALSVIRRMVWEIALEMRGYTKGEIDEQLGNCQIDRDRIDNPGSDSLGGAEFSSFAGGRE